MEIRISTTRQSRGPMFSSSASEWSEMGGNRAGKNLLTKMSISSIGRTTFLILTIAAKRFIRSLRDRYLCSLTRILASPISKDEEYKLSSDRPTPRNLPGSYMIRVIVDTIGFRVQIPTRQPIYLSHFHRSMQSTGTGFQFLPA